MATDRCIELLLSAPDFGALSTQDQANRLARFMADWFDLNHKLDTVDHVRFTARLRTHASKMKISAGETMELLLPTARRLHAQAVVEQEATRIFDEDRRAAELAGEMVEEPLTEITTAESTNSQSDQEPVYVIQARSKPRRSTSRS
jgi:hypothetical protein